MKPFNLLTSFVLLLCFLLLPEFSFSDDIAGDMAALRSFSSAVRGNTIRWDVSLPTPCNWTGVTCDNVINRVTDLSLPGDGLSGEIPANTIGNLTQLRRLSLRGNRLSGGLPQDLELCTELRFVYLQNNNFSGDIPASLYRLRNLIRLDITGNNFSGFLPPNFGDLRSLTYLNVSMNRLSGRIPDSLARFPNNSFVGNALCGAPLNSCEDGSDDDGKLSGGAIAGIVAGAVFGSVLILGVIFIMLRKFTKTRTSNRAVVQDVASTTPSTPVKYDYRSPDHIMAGENTGSDEGYSGRVESGDDLVFFGEGGFLLDDLLRASAEVMGKGVVGTTYKAYLRQGEVIVKRLKNVCVSKREFTKKIVSIGELYHENILPIKGYYFGKEEKLLVFDYMPIGSLYSLLHGNMEERSQLTWEIRSKIAFEVASGLEHLHSRNLSHGNIKSNNILLTYEFQALVSESGLIQLVTSSTPNLSGYRAPELIDTRVASKDADVYSFGILILELLTGKDPTVLLNEEGIDVPTWVQSVDEARWISDVYDSFLVNNANNEDKIIKLLHLGIRCASQVPRRRGSMTEVAKQIKKICKF
ncbi:leucine-rich repeat protein [Artemisia annua]|uniref:Leucine-rich repeat protein n=1 Tax=Artemisia annua TaxID=35608 RepID=A0A2U1NRY6_ARTAN|nr:leucine-rich repeat protein [Artemisia annua]